MSGKAKGGMGKLAAVVAVVLILVGGVGAGAVVADRAGLLPGGAGGAPHTPPPSPPPAYVALTGNFTANLAESGRFVQIGLGVSTREGPDALEQVRANEIAVRSAVIETLAAQPESAVSSAPGRAALRKALAASVNAALVTAGAKAVVADVHFTSLVVQ